MDKCVECAAHTWVFYLETFNETDKFFRETASDVDAHLGGRGSRLRGIVVTTDRGRR